MRPGRDAVDGDPVRPELARERLRPADDARPDRVREREVVDRLADRARTSCSRSAPPRCARRCGRQRPVRRTTETSSSSTALSTSSRVELGGGGAWRAAAVVHEDVDAAEGLDGRRRRGARDRPGSSRRRARRAPPIRSASRSRSSAPPREHDDVRALAGERLGDGEPDPRRRAADDRGPAAETEIHRYFRFRTPTTSRTRPPTRGASSSPPR